MSSSRKFFLLIGLPFLLGGCSYQPIEDAHDLTVVGIPQQWEQEKQSVNLMTEDPWLEQLGDRRLKTFVDEAVNNSYVLKAGMARMAQAEAVVRLQGGGKYPTLGLDFTTGAQENFSSVLGVVKTDINSLSLSSNWEIDIWGKVRKEQAAAFAQLQAAGYSYADLLLTMQSTVSKTWFSAVEAKLQLELAIQNRDSFVDNLSTLEDRYLKGLVDAFDLRLFRAQSAANEAVVKQREVAYKTLVFQLQTLASLIPNGALELSDELPSLSGGVPIGIPSEVLLRRPDVRAAERQLAATVGQRDATAKNWLPSFRITGS